MHEYLDKIEDSITRSRKYSTIALVFSCIIYSTGAYIAYAIHYNIQNIHPWVLLSIFFISILLGLAFTVYSFTNKEPQSTRKWVGAALNAIMFLAIFSILAYEFIIGF